MSRLEGKQEARNLDDVKYISTKARGDEVHGPVKNGSLVFKGRGRDDDRPCSVQIPDTHT